MSTVVFGLDEIYDLAKQVMLANGCDNANAAALADIIARAERDGSHSHGLFRVPGYVKALRSSAGRWARQTIRQTYYPHGNSG